MDGGENSLPRADYKQLGGGREVSRRRLDGEKVTTFLGFT